MRDILLLFIALLIIFGVITLNLVLIGSLPNMNKPVGIPFAVVVIMIDLFIISTLIALD